MSDDPSRLLGSQVVLAGLSRAELNGERGVVVSYDPKKGRLGVKLQKGSLLSVKPSNAVPADCEGVTPVDLNVLLDGSDFVTLRAVIAAAGARPGCTPLGNVQLTGDASTIVSVMRAAPADVPSEQVALEGCNALAKLSSSDMGGKQLVRQANGAAALLGAIDGASAPVLEAGCRALTNLSNGDDACKRAVVDAGGAAAVVAIMRKEMSSATMQHRIKIQQLCCGTIANLANGDTKCLATAIAAGGAPAVVAAMRSHPYEGDLLGDACLALANIASHKGGGGADAVCEAGGPRVLVKTILAHSESVPKVRYWGAAAIANLTSSDGESKEVLLDEGGVGAVVHVMETCPAKEGSVLRMCAGALTHIANFDEQGRREISATGGVTTVTKCMAVADDVSLVEECLRAAASMVFAESDCHHMVRKANLTPVLENILLRFPAEAKVQEMGRALLNRSR